MGIDDVTFGELQQRWPFPRSFHARAIDRLSEAGAKVVAYDVQFTEPSATRDEDNALIDAVDARGQRRARDDRGQRGRRSNVFGGDDVLREESARAPANGQLPERPAAA